MTFLAYITGQLAPGERDAFEHRLMEDSVFSNEMEEQEFALLEEYAENTLPTDQREHVEAWLTASPYHREHLAITRALSRLGAQKTTRPMRVPLWWMATAACVALVAVVFFMWHKRSSPTPPQVAVVRPLPNTQAPPAASSRFESNTILLQSERLRGPNTEATQTYVVKPDLPTRIQILVTNTTGASSYSLSIRSTTDSHFAPLYFGGLPTKSQASEQYVEAILPGALPPGTYSATLQSSAGRYRLNWSVRAETQPPQPIHSR
jgi:hypothetical protein